MGDQKHKVEFFGFTTCSWCKKTKAWLDENGIEVEVVYMNELEGDERKQAKERILEFASRISFPCVIIDDGAEVVQGYKPDKYEEFLK